MNPDIDEHGETWGRGNPGAWLLLAAALWGGLWLVWRLVG
jgi:hypothetical protein